MSQASTYLDPHIGGDKTCRICGASFTIEPCVPEIIARLTQVCGRCSERKAEQDQAELVSRSKALRAERWKRICPPGYLETVPHKLPCPGRLQSVLAWRYGPQGLLLHGPTGAGKSRVAWMLLRREWESGRGIECLNAMAGLTYSAKYSGSASDVERWIERMSRVELLLMDDVFKSRLTDSFESAIFTVVLRRTEARLPTIAAVNDTGASLIARLSPDRGEPLVRRLREFCDPIAFTP